MRNMLTARRGMALLLALAILLPCFSVATPTLADSPAGYSVNFDSHGTDGPYLTYAYGSSEFTSQGNYGNQANSYAYAKIISGDGYDGSDRYMELSYTQAAAANKVNQHAFFSLPDKSGSAPTSAKTVNLIKLEKDKSYTVAVTYRVTGYSAPATLDLVLGMGERGLHLEDKKDTRLQVATVAEITEVTGGWATAKIVYRATEEATAHIRVKVADHANRAGTVVQVGAVTIDPYAGTVPPSYSYDFDKYGTDGPYSNTFCYGSSQYTSQGMYGSQAASYAYAKIVSGEGYNASNQYMELSYTQAAAANKVNQHAFFSLPDKSGSAPTSASDVNIAHTVKDQLYRIKVVYKVTGYSSPATLDFVMGMGDTNLHQFDDSDANLHVVTVANITGTTTDWVTAEILYTAPADASTHIRLKVADHANRAGTKVQIGAVSVSAHMFPPVKLTFDSNGGSAVAPIYGAPGMKVDYPTPVNGTKTFNGWGYENGIVAPTVFPQEDSYFVAFWDGEFPHERNTACEVNFYTGSGTAVPGVTGIEGLPLPTSAVSRKEDFTFNGWYADAACTKLVTEFPAQSTTLYAGWVPASGYMQTFESVGRPNGSELKWTNGFEGQAIRDVFDHYTYLWPTNRAYDPVNGYAVELVTGNSYVRTGETAMKMEYTAPADGSTNPDMRAAFRIPDAEANRIVTTSGKTYAVSFYYKVEDLPDEATGALNVYGGSFNWSGFVNNSQELTTVALADTISEAKIGGWRKATAVIKGSSYAAPTLYIALDMDNPSRRGGTRVYIDDITVTELTHYETITANGDVTLSTERKQVRRGIHSVEMAASTPGSGVADINRVVYADSLANKILDAGIEYNTTVWLYSPEAFTGNLVIVADGYLEDFSEGIIQHKVSVSLPAKTWVPVSQSIVLGTPSYVSFGLEGTGTVYMDDVLVAPYTEEPRLVQDYERYEAKTHVGNDVLHGNADGRTVTDTANNTVNGKHALQLTMKSDAPADYARTVLGFDIDRGDYIGTVGKGYVVDFRAMSTTGGTVTFALGSADMTDLRGQVTNVEDGATAAVTLLANQWTGVRLTAKSLTQMYITLGAWFDGASGSNSGIVYIDDVQLANYYASPADGLQDNIWTFDEGDLMPGDVLSLDVANGSRITATTKFNHTEGGAYGARVEATSQGNSYTPSFGAAQMLVRDGKGDVVRLEAGKNYRVTFWLYVPTDCLAASFKYWLTADESTTGYTTNSQKNNALLYETDRNEYDKEQGIGTEPNLNRGVWYRMSRTLVNIDHGGNLRLGLCATFRDNTVFYVDDIQVSEVEMFDPDPTEKTQSFERYGVGDDSFVLTNEATVSNKFAHTGNQSLECVVKSTSQVDSNQIYLVNPATGKPHELTEGQTYTLSFWAYIPKSEAPYLRLNYWMLGSEYPVMVNRADQLEARKCEYNIGFSSELMMFCDEWKRIEVSFVAKKDCDYLLMGFTDIGKDGIGMHYYIDDILLLPAKDSIVTFDANGGTDFEEIQLKGVMGYTLSAPVMSDPYREGYEFTGWYRDKEGKDQFVFDETILDAEEITLYAGWREWTELPAQWGTEDDKEYKTVVNEEKVWTGKAVNPLIPNSDVPETLEPLPLEDVPSKPGDTSPAGISTWLIIVILAAVVLIVGGGVLIVILLKKSKKKGGA